MRSFRIIPVLYTFIIFLLLFGCEKTEDKNIFNIQIEKKRYVYEVNEIQVESSLFVYKAVGDLIDICIAYPQIIYMPDSQECEIRDAINKNIFDDILEDFDFFNFKKFREHISIDFEVTYLDDEKICIIYYGEADAGQPNLFTHTAAFDMLTGEKLNANDYFIPVLTNLKDGSKSDSIQKLYNINEIKKNMEIGYFEADLNGDGHNDIIVLMQDKNDKLEILLNDRGKYHKILSTDLNMISAPLSFIFENGYLYKPYYNLYITNDNTNGFYDIIMVTENNGSMIWRHKDDKYEN